LLCVLLEERALVSVLKVLILLPALRSLEVIAIAEGE